MNVFIFLFDGFSDWEIAYLTPEIAKSEQHTLNTLSVDGERIRSAGGLSVVPDISVAGVDVKDIDVLVLPGGEAWERQEITGINALVKEVYNQHGVIAAICAGTTFLGQNGYLDKVKHTSNDLNYLKQMAPAYNGEINYLSDLAVTDSRIITANGVAPIEFAREVFKAIRLFEAGRIEKWYQLFKNGIWSE